MDYSVQSGFFVFTSEIEKLIKSNRVKDGVIVCEIGIRVRDAKRVTSVFSKFSFVFNRILL